MDDLSNGQPISKVYLELWARTFDENFVTLSKPKELAFHSGHAGQRAERAWKDRIRVLRDLGFIETKEGASGPFSYALLKNPYLVTKQHYLDGRVPQEQYNALIERCLEIGETSLDDEVPISLTKEPKKTAVKKAKKDKTGPAIKLLVQHSYLYVL